MQVFHIKDGEVEVIALDIPGKDDKKKTLNAYILEGIGELLLSGDPAFNDKSARALCKKLGCYNSANHATYIKDRGKEITGSKNKGWVLTAPGLRRGASLIKELSGDN